MDTLAEHEAHSGLTGAVEGGRAGRPGGQGGVGHGFMAVSLRRRQPPEGGLSRVAVTTAVGRHSCGR